MLTEVTLWQNRPLESLYPLMVFDALRVKIRAGGSGQNKAAHLALGIRADGLKEVLGLWRETNEGAQFWLQVLTELQNRGVRDILIAGVDGLKGFPDASNAVFPQTEVPTRIAHLARHSLSYVGWRDRKLGAEEFAPHLSGRNRRTGPPASGRVCRREMGPGIAHHRGLLAAGLGTGHPVLCVSPGRAPGERHPQRD